MQEDGKMYVFSETDSDKNKEIKNNSQVQLFFANTGNSEYLNVFGDVIISNDRDKIKKRGVCEQKHGFRMVQKMKN